MARSCLTDGSWITGKPEVDRQTADRPLFVIGLGGVYLDTACPPAQPSCGSLGYERSVFQSLLFNRSNVFSHSHDLLNSGIYESACSVLLGILYGERHVGRLFATSGTTYEGLHIRLRHPVPDQVACIEVSTSAHDLASCMVVQEFNCHICKSVSLQALACIIKELFGSVALFLSSLCLTLIRLVFDGPFHFVDPALNGLSSLQLC